MAHCFPFVIMIVSTVLLLISEKSLSIPIQGDIHGKLDGCNKNLPHVIVINKTDGRILNCHQCLKCQKGLGLNIPCNGENVTNLHVECEHCVPGTNYSTGDFVQCQPCLHIKCNSSQWIEGTCGPIEDERTCRGCKLQNWYYNTTSHTCMPCSCENMTQPMLKICSAIGFNISRCIKKKVSSEEVNNDKMAVKYIIAIASVIIATIAIVVLLIWRWKVLVRKQPNLSPCTGKWFLKMCFCNASTENTSAISTIQSERLQNGYNTSSYVRQNSCPTTQDEKCKVQKRLCGKRNSEENLKLLSKPEYCKQKKLKFFDMNNGTCFRIFQVLKDNIDAGMGYPSLAGKMGFTANEMKSFQSASKDVCENMFECWSNRNMEENNVLKLMHLVKEIKRDDIFQLLKEQLNKAKDDCGCNDCITIS